MIKATRRTLLLSMLYCLVKVTSPSSNDDHSFTSIDGYLCINSQYVEEHSEITETIGCAVLCNRNNRCQAFTTVDGPCQHFVFDKCSKSVRDCSCSRRGQVFVKQQPGLQPGALCPSGYGDDLCGVKYKLYVGSGFWGPSRQKCESDGDLVIMADVTDGPEMQHIDMMYSKYSIGYFFLGGYQPAGSPEPAGGWYWIGCNIPFNSSYWAADEPNNMNGRENTLGRYKYSMITDLWENEPVWNGAMCECVSPFD